MNYFQTKTAAERYSAGRPDFHRHTIKLIKEYLNLEKKFDKALDVACGTGLSTKALLEIALDIYGTDTSMEMLNHAPIHENIQYKIASAEQQPFESHFFDLLTVCSGVHWFDIDKFLMEANRLLKSKSWLLLYDNYFIADMEGNDQFANWFPQVYVKKFPSPPRKDNYSWTNENLQPFNFSLVEEKRFTNSVRFTKKQLVLYFTTQSNIIAAVERNETSYEEVENWLDKELSLFFEQEDSCRTIHYGNWIKFIQKVS